MTDAQLRYTFTCPACSGNFSIQLDRIPTTRARFRCPHCKQPMDFPSREEARAEARLPAAVAAPSKPPAREPVAPPIPPAPGPEPPAPTHGSRFRVLKGGFDHDVFDRRAIRNQIRTGEIEETDRLSVDEGEPVRAEELPYLKSLFNLRRSAKTTPPRCCRTHSEKVAFFLCSDSGRPLCEDCALEKRFGNATIRVCQHCGGAASELKHA